MAPSPVTLEVRRMVIRKLLREGRIGPEARPLDRTVRPEPPVRAKA
jgi:hypothetical protein